MPWMGGAGSCPAPPRLRLPSSNHTTTAEDNPLTEADTFLRDVPHAHGGSEVPPRGTTSKDRSPVAVLDQVSPMLQGSGPSSTSTRWRSPSTEEAALDETYEPCFVGDRGVAVACAAWGKQWEHVHALVHAGHTPATRVSRSCKLTALMAAACYGHIETVRVLLLAGAPVDARDSQGRTALTFAARYGHSQACIYLLRHGADIDAVDTSQASALVHAIVCGELATAELLVAHGAAADDIDAISARVHHVLSRSGAASAWPHGRPEQLAPHAILRPAARVWHWRATVHPLPAACKLVLLIARIPRVGSKCASALRRVPNEVWMQIFRKCGVTLAETNAIRSGGFSSARAQQLLLTAPQVAVALTEDEREVTDTPTLSPYYQSVRGSTPPSELARKSSRNSLTAIATITAVTTTTHGMPNHAGLDAGGVAVAPGEPPLKRSRRCGGGSGSAVESEETVHDLHDLGWPGGDVDDLWAGIN